MSKRFVRATNRCVACWGMAPTHSVASTNLAISAHCAPSSGGRKGAAHARAGQALRGSSEFHAWGDSNLYLRRVGEQLTLTVEHRAAASITGITLALAGERTPTRRARSPPRRTASRGPSPRRPRRSP